LNLEIDKVFLGMEKRDLGEALAGRERKNDVGAIFKKNGGTRSSIELGFWKSWKTNRSEQKGFVG